MAMGLSSNKRRRGRPAAISEINITPMVDVMLVLLIVFMVAAPLMATGVPIDLPEVQANAIPFKTKPITITVVPDGTLSIEDEHVTTATLVAAVQALASDGRDERLYIRGDATAAYGRIMEVMGALSAAGYARIGLLTDPAPAP